MNHQMLRLSESLVTLGAGVLLLHHVDCYMAPQASSLRECPVTLGKGLGLLSSMNSHVPPQVF